MNETTVCSTELSELNTGGVSIVSPNYPNNYPHNQHCDITIKFGPEKRVLLKFEVFQLYEDKNEVDCNYDWLEVYDDEDIKYPSGGALCKSYNPGRIESSRNTMRLVFHSDGQDNELGFKIDVEELGNFSAL